MFLVEKNYVLLKIMFLVEKNFIWQSISAVLENIIKNENNCMWEKAIIFSPYILPTRRITWCMSDSNMKNKQRIFEKQTVCLSLNKLIDISRVQTLSLSLSFTLSGRACVALSWFIFLGTRDKTTRCDRDLFPRINIICEQNCQIVDFLISHHSTTNTYIAYPCSCWCS